jgi:PKD repeat protein
MLIMAVVLVAGTAAAEQVLIIPAAASAPGVGDAFFVTDVRLFNPDPSNTITVHLAYLRRNRDNTSAAEVSRTIGPRQGLALNDVVATVFGIEGAGGLRLRSDSPFFATSRTYNVGGEAGTFGQFIPGLSPDDAVQSGILLQVVNDPTMTGFRANVGFANPHSQEVKVTVRVFNLDTGQLLGESEKTLRPLAVLQINDVFKEIGVADLVFGNASVEFEAEMPVLGYASVLDNTSDDPIYVMPFADAGTPNEDNNPPNGTIDSPATDVTVSVGEGVDFAGSVNDPDGDEVTVLWDFGDDTTATEEDPGEHSYSEAGAYTVTFTATDEHGSPDTTPDTRTVTVEEAENNPPNGTITSPPGNQTIEVGGSVAFAGSVSDPDGDDVTVLWDFGDDTTSTQLDPGSHTYSEAGVFTVVFTATDEHGLPDSTPDVRTITVEEPASLFTRVQNEIFSARCARSGCHGNGSANAGLQLDEGVSYDETVNEPSTQRPADDRIEPGDTANSYLWRKVNGGPDIDGARMPLTGGALSQAQLDLLEDWIEAGAPDENGNLP